MTHPAVAFVLDAVAQSWPTGNFADIPAVRVDRDNSRVFDGDGAIDLSQSTRQNTEQLRDSNVIGAAVTGTDEQPIGTEFDLQKETAVSLRVEGLSADEWGYVDSEATYPPASDADSVPWHEFTRDLRRAVYAGRKFPQVGEQSTNYTHLTVENVVPDASAYHDYYRFEADVRFDGFEILP